MLVSAPWQPAGAVAAALLGPHAQGDQLRAWAGAAGAIAPGLPCPNLRQTPHTAAGLMSAAASVLPQDASAPVMPAKSVFVKLTQCRLSDPGRLLGRLSVTFKFIWPLLSGL